MLHSVSVLGDVQSCSIQQEEKRCLLFLFHRLRTSGAAPEQRPALHTAASVNTLVDSKCNVSAATEPQRASVHTWCCLEVTDSADTAFPGIAALCLPPSSLIELRHHEG